MRKVKAEMGWDAGLRVELWIIENGGWGMDINRQVIDRAEVRIPNHQRERLENGYNKGGPD